MEDYKQGNPMYEDEETGNGKYLFSHNPVIRPKGHKASYRLRLHRTQTVAVFTRAPCRRYQPRNPLSAPHFLDSSAFLRCKFKFIGAVSDRVSSAGRISSSRFFNMAYKMAISV